MDRPYMRTESRFHRRSNPQGLVNPREVVVHVPDGNHVRVVLDLLTECIGQPSKSGLPVTVCGIAPIQVAGLYRVFASRSLP